MSYTTTYRAVNSCASGLLLSIAAMLYLVPGVLDGHSPLMIFLLKLGWGGIVAVALLMPVQAFSEHTVITDDGLIKAGLFGSETRMAWNEIYRFQVKPDSNEVIFRDNGKRKLKMSLAYDGWQDFLDVAAKRLNPALYWQFRYTVANLDAKKKVSSASKKLHWPKWFSFGRSKRVTSGE